MSGENCEYHEVPKEADFKCSQCSKSICQSCSKKVTRHHSDSSRKTSSMYCIPCNHDRIKKTVMLYRPIGAVAILAGIVISILALVGVLDGLFFYGLIFVGIGAMALFQSRIIAESEKELEEFYQSIAHA